MSLCRIVELGVDPVSDYVDAIWPVIHRRPKADPAVARAVAKIIDGVDKRGAKAAAAYARKFDSPFITAKRLAVTARELEEATVSDEQLAAIRTSIERVSHFHESQLKALTKGWKRKKGHTYEEKRWWEWRIPATDAANSGYEGQRLLPLERVGVYVPGGMAAYPSSVIMNAVPAIVAGVEDIQLCTPARPDGSLHPAVLVACRELGIEKIAKVGGAAAVAYLGLGDASDQNWSFMCQWLKCDKVVGPGNRWVNEAKRQLWGSVGLDSYAGPSEVVVAADHAANPAFAAADWLTQIEHAPDNLGVLVTQGRDVAEAILAEVEKLLTGSPRETTMRQALRDHGLVVVLKKRYEALGLASAMAGEHVSLMVEDPEAALAYLQNGGCALLGDYTPQSAGDFVSGPSHTLPTAGAARFGSPVNVMDFLKFQSVSYLTKADLELLTPTIEAFGEMEGFPQHARGATIRFEND